MTVGAVSLRTLLPAGWFDSTMPARTSRERRVKAVLRKLGVRPLRRQTLELADGRTVIRHKGVALFRFREYVGGADVIFGEKGDATLLGAFSLEALGLALDPIKRTLRPAKLLM